MRSTWRGSYDEFGWTSRPLPSILWLLGANFLVFCAQKIVGAPFEEYLGLSPLGVSHGFFWQFFTYMFLHASAWHLFWNLLTLFIFGNEMEHELGSKKFLQMYFLGGLVGGGVWYLFNFNHPEAMVIGASGAICAVILAFAALFPDRPITLLVFFILPITLLARWWAILVVGITMVLSMEKSGSVAHIAHLGGMAVGYLYIKALINDWRFPRIRWKSTSFSSAPKFRALPKPSEKDPLTKSDYMAQKIDPILDKIAEQGIQSLTREERHLLEKAKDKLP